MGWRVRALLLDTLDMELRESGLIKWAGWHDKVNHRPPVISRSSFDRICRGISTTDYVLRAFFAFLYGKHRDPDLNKMPKETKEKVADAFKKYCEKKPNPPRQVRQSPPTANPIECMTVYLKAIHLRRRGRDVPAYRRHMPHRNETIDVFDEFTAFVTIYYRGGQNRRRMQWPGAAEAIDLQMVLPPDALPFQGAYTLVNLVQAGRLQVNLPDDADRLIVVVDLASLPAALHPEPPTVYYQESSDDTFRLHPLSCQISRPGAFVIDTATAGAGDPGSPLPKRLALMDGIELRLPINWEALA